MGCFLLIALLRPTSSEAAAAFERGVAAYRDGEHAAACAAFERSYALEPNAGVARNAALSCLAAGRCVRALTFFERAGLREEPPVLDARACAPPVRIEATPPAAVQIDGEARGSTPFESRLDVGTHAVRLTAEGHREETAEMVVERGRPVSLTRALRPAPGEVRIECTPGDTYRLDGRAVKCAAGEARLEVDPGPHLVRVTRPGCGAAESERAVPPGASLRFALAPSCPPAAAEPVGGGEAGTSNGGPSGWFWGSVAATAAGAAVGGYFLGRSLSATEDADEEMKVPPDRRDGTRVRQLRQDARDDAVLAYIGLGTAALGAASAVTAFLWDDGGLAAASPALRLGVAPGGLAVGGSW